MAAATTSEPAVRVKDLCIGWDDSVLMEHLTFDIERASVFAILGGSGAGKSTLLRYLVGLDEPKGGSVEIVGHGAPDLEDGLPPFGVMFQGGALFGSMTVCENVALPLVEWGRLDEATARAVATAKLRLVGLAGAVDKIPSELSGGMKKRAAIARALAMDPPLVFLDEPSAGLDPVTSSELDDLIRTLAEQMGITVVIVTHELESVFNVVQRCILLDKQAKGIIADGDPSELKDSEDPRVRRFFRRESAHADTQEDG